MINACCSVWPVQENNQVRTHGVISVIQAFYYFCLLMRQHGNWQRTSNDTHPRSDSEEKGVPFFISVFCLVALLIVFFFFFSHDTGGVEEMPGRRKATSSHICRAPLSQRAIYSRYHWKIRSLPGDLRGYHLSESAGIDEPLASANRSMWTGKGKWAVE